MMNVGGDLFATKGVEYLLVIGYLVLLAGVWRFFAPRRDRKGEPKPSKTLPEGLYFHQGHTWAAPENEETMRVGVDQYARRQLDEPVGVELPKIGTQLFEGEPGWQVRLSDGRLIPMLSPVDGEVVAVNGEIIDSPALLGTDPYDRGWVLKVKVPNPQAARWNLLSGDLAQYWLEHEAAK